MATLAIGASRVFELGRALQVDKRKLGDVRSLVAVSSVMTKTVDSPRFEAVIDTVEASFKAGIFHIIMLDDSSPPEAANLLRTAGAAVAVINHDTEGGLARPYVIAAQIINRFVPQAIMVKFEGEKSVFGRVENLARFIEIMRHCDIVTGERTEDTWASMPPYLAVTETWLGPAIGQLLGVSEDTPSGVILLNEQGRNVFIDTTDENSWPYLFLTPFYGAKQRLRVGVVSVVFAYHESVVEEEAGNPTFDQKRDQIDKMLDRALACRGEESLNAGERLLVRRMRRFRDQLDLVSTFAENRARALADSKMAAVVS